MDLVGTGRIGAGVVNVVVAVVASLIAALSGLAIGRTLAV